MGKGYLDEMGEYCEAGPHFHSRKVSNKYWNSLTREEQEVIQWCRDWARSNNNHIIQFAECRNHWIVKFVASLGYPETPKKQEAYKICFDNFRAFKKFVNDNQNI